MLPWLILPLTIPSTASSFTAPWRRGKCTTSCWRTCRETWEQCVIRGRLEESGGFKAFQYDRVGPEHGAWLFTSQALPEKFPELDDFEGAGYRRLVIPARVGRRRVLANVYESREFA